MQTSEKPAPGRNVQLPGDPATRVWLSRFDYSGVSVAAGTAA